MDSISQFVLGASVGYLLAGKDRGKKAIFIGGLAATLPDLDTFFIKPFEYDDLTMLIHHRGFTHSLLFAVLAPILCAWGSRSWFKSLTFKGLYWWYFWVFLTHSLLDCFTSWGTQFFWPHPYKVAFNAIFIIDPLYTLPLMIGLLGYKRPGWVKKGVIISCMYLLLCVGMKGYMYHRIKQSIQVQSIPAIRFTYRPTPFNCLLWSTTIESKHHFFFSTYSIFDSKSFSPMFAVPKQHHLLPYEQMPSRLKSLIYVTKEYYSLEKTASKMIVRDLRFGLFGDPLRYGPIHIFSHEIQRPISESSRIIMKRSEVPNMGQHFKELFFRMFPFIKK